MPEVVRLRAAIAYDGTAFAGWARQPGQRTVNGEFTAALERVLGVEVEVTVAGRTDAGVHAVGQVAHVDVDAGAYASVADTLVRRLAGVLPPDVRVTALAPAAPGFDARFSALRRHYAYRVADAAWGVAPLRRADTLAWRRPLNVDAMAAAAAGLLGEHDFAPFCRRREGATTIRELQRFAWRRDDDGVLTASVSADAFCHSMVRSLVGALLAVGDGRRPPGWPAALLDRADDAGRAGDVPGRAGDVVVAPAHGLTLVAVDYPPADQLTARAAVTRARRAPPCP